MSSAVKQDESSREGNEEEGKKRPNKQIRPHRSLRTSFDANFEHVHKSTNPSSSSSLPPRYRVTCEAIMSASRAEEAHLFRLEAHRWGIRGADGLFGSAVWPSLHRPSGTVSRPWWWLKKLLGSPPSALAFLLFHPSEASELKKTSLVQFCPKGQ